MVLIHQSTSAIDCYEPHKASCVSSQVISREMHKDLKKYFWNVTASKGLMYLWDQFLFTALFDLYTEYYGICHANSVL